jgi:hypothetical protein
MLAAPVRLASRPAARAPRMQAIAGFEATDYALLNGRVVWAGSHASTDHPRNINNPWQPSPFSGNPARLQRSALNCLDLLRGPLQPGLLTWLQPSLGADPMPWWLTQAMPRLNSLALALQSNDLSAFEAAALRLLGLGPGLTPSGDDLVGATFFALRQAPRARWAAELPAVRSRVSAAAREATNVISAALLEDLLDGRSYRPLHELITALDSEDPSRIAAAMQALLRVGASSGADMLSGVLMTLSTWQETF